MSNKLKIVFEVYATPFFIDIKLKRKSDLYNNHY
jgi:hypothetical protein